MNRYKPAKRTAEEHFGNILEDSVNEIFIFDAESMKFVMVNRGARENLRYSEGEMRELTPVDIKPEFTRERFERLIEPLVKGIEQKLVFQTVHERKDGSRYDVEIHLQLTQFGGRSSYVAIVLDVSERLKSEELVRVQQAAINASGNGIVITDINQPDNPIIFANPAFYALTGYSEEETIGRNCRFLQGDERDQQERGELCAAIRRGNECRVVIRNYRKDGTLFWNEVTISPVRDESGRLTHFIGVQHDVTKQRLAEDELKGLNVELDARVRKRGAQLEEAQEELIRKEKLATLGQLAGSVAHEIRTPLSVIRNAAYYLEASAKTPDKETKESFAEISRGIADATHILEELLDYAREPKVKRVEFSMDKVIDEGVLGAAIPESVSLCRSKTVEVEAWACGDIQQIGRILRNLLENGAQAMPEGGRLTVSCRHGKENVVMVEVSDTGVGIAKDQLGKIFEPLHTTKARGIGLGLALSQRYASLNRGRLEVESAVGEGSTFTLTLPRAQKSV